MSLLTDLKTELARLGRNAVKLRGQHFLIDEKALATMVEGVVSGERVLEIGPGLGVLTEALLAKGASVTAVELDPGLADALEAKFRGGITLHRGDAMRLDLSNLMVSAPYRVIANIPYSITSPLIEKLVHAEVPPTSIRFMVQKEVAERVSVKPPQMNSLALMVQLHAKPEILAIVKKGSFSPPPKVDSAILQLTMIPDHVRDDSHFHIETLAKQAFLAPRKKVMNTLPVQVKNFAEVGLTGNERPAEIALDQWKKIAQQNGVV